MEEFKQLESDAKPEGKDLFFGDDEQEDSYLEGTAAEDDAAEGRSPRGTVGVGVTVVERSEDGEGSGSGSKGESYLDHTQGGPSSPASVIYCSRCGTPNGPNARFCDHCGSPLAKIAMDSAPEAPAQRSQPQPAYAAPPSPSPKAAPSSSSSSGGKGNGALVCGILSIVFSIFFLSIVGLILGIIGAVMASNAKKAGTRNGITTGATVTSIIGLVLSIIGLVGCTIVGGAMLNYGLASMSYL